MRPSGDRACGTRRATPRSIATAISWRPVLPSSVLARPGHRNGGPSRWYVAGAGGPAILRGRAYSNKKAWDRAREEFEARGIDARASKLLSRAIPRLLVRVGSPPKNGRPRPPRRRTIGSVRHFDGPVGRERKLGKTGRQEIAVAIERGVARRVPHARSPLGRIVRGCRDALPRPRGRLSRRGQTRGASRRARLATAT